jgi:hypothetical protein
MAPQPGQTSEFKLLPHLHFGLESCPTCGQTIPADKLEEISGRIAAREHERKLAITAQVEKQYASEKARADAKAKADLEAERQQSAAREVRAREEAQQASESVAAERIQAIEVAQRESVAVLQAKVNESETNRIAAEQRQSALQSQLEKLREANEAEIARMKEDAATEAARMHKVATEQAELRYRDTLAAQEKAVAEANTKAGQAEKHAFEMEQNLSAQREILERAKEDAVNTEKAKAFEENQKLSTKVNDLQRALEKKTNEELGEGAEINIFEALKSEFKDDRIERIPKGAPGADIRHVVKHRGQECGTILYDSKNHNQWRVEHATKLKKDQLAEKAEHAILSTHKFPQGARQLHTLDGVLLANPARVVSVAGIIRQHLIQVHTLRLSKIERENKTAALYEFITSEHCRQLLDRVDERAGSLLELQGKEIKWHQNNWKHQGAAIRAIQKAKGDLACEIDSIIGTSADDTEISEAS